MQWLINIAKAAMEQWIYDNGIYRYRGDPAAADFASAALTKDGAWHNLDLSAIVPLHAKAVNFTIWFNVVQTAKNSYFRINGQTNAYNISQIISQVASIPKTADLQIAVDDTRIIQYKIEAATWIFYYITVKGWWL
jgi:hypothetical protein